MCIYRYTSFSHRAYIWICIASLFPIAHLSVFHHREDKHLAAPPADDKRALSPARTRPRLTNCKKYGIFLLLGVARYLLGVVLILLRFLLLVFLVQGRSRRTTICRAGCHTREGQPHRLSVIKPRRSGAPPSDLVLLDAIGSHLLVFGPTRRLLLQWPLGSTSRRHLHPRLGSTRRRSCSTSCSRRPGSASRSRPLMGATYRGG